MKSFLKEQCRIDPLLVASFVVMAMLAFAVTPSWGAEQKLDPKFDRETCWSWGGSSASQGQYTSCPANVVVVTETKTVTEVKEVKVPVPIVAPVPISPRKQNQ